MHISKTRKSISKRFKVTHTGKVLFRTSGKRHCLRSKTVKQRRGKGQDKQASNGVKRFVQIAAPSLFR
jgi:large subunit ribosomal protein L35